MKKRGQAAIEFLVFVGVAMLLLVVYVGISNHYLNLLYNKEKAASADDFLQTIANEFNIAARVENGYSRTIQLPAKTGKYDYSLYVGDMPGSTGSIGSKREVVIYSESKEYVKTLSVDAVDKCSVFTDEQVCIGSYGYNCEWNNKCFSNINMDPRGVLIIKKTNNEIIFEKG